MPSTTLDVRARDGTRLRARRWTPEGDAWAAMVIVHGIAEHSGRYERRRGVRRRRRDVHAFDLRGHGGSEGRRGDMGRWGDNRDDVAEAIERARGNGGSAPGGTARPLGWRLLALDAVLEGVARPTCSCSRRRRSAMPCGLAAPPRRGRRPVRSDDAGGQRVARQGAVARTRRSRGGRGRPGLPRAHLPAYRPRRVHGPGAGARRPRPAQSPHLGHHGADDRLVPRGERAARRAAVGDPPRLPGPPHECLNEPEGPLIVADIVAWLRDQVDGWGSAQRAGVD